MFKIIGLMSVVALCFVKSQSDIFKIGVGIGDITGPSGEVTFMGYVNLAQSGQGIHLRQFARTVIIGDGTKTIVYVSIDLCMASQLIKLEVVKRIKDKYNGKYNINNIVIASTHTHSAPGGFLNYLLYNMPVYGFVKQVFEAVVSGILNSIDRAHNTIKDGNIYYNEGELTDASINRSPSSYLLNPAAERSQYQYDTDKIMQVLKLTDTAGKSRAVITFFPVHATSMNRTNRLISSDNKGAASIFFEKAVNPPGTLPGKGEFVALFPNGNSGDVSPNTKGGLCSGTTIECDSSAGDCDDCSKCVADGPGKDDEDSTLIIAQKQSDKAKSLSDTATMKLTGPIGFIYEPVDMSNYSMTMDGKNVTTCKPAVGFSMFAGTTDGPGLPYLCQGIKSPIQLNITTLFGPSNPLWNKIAPYAQTVYNDLTLCHAPKPVLIPSGEINNFAVPIQPTILPTQILQIGKHFIIAVPGEFTTMAGRRLTAAVKSSLISAPDATIMLSGHSNAYSSYVTTYEEYQAQRYEAASTIYGPYTLSAYIDQFVKLAGKLVNNVASITSPAEPNYYLQAQSETLNFVPKNIADLLVTFGQVITQPEPSYVIGQTVSVTFQGAHPNNDLRTGGTYLTVEKCSTANCQGTTTVIATDGSWETKFRWVRPVPLVGKSEVTIEWTIPIDTIPGTYQIRYFGNSSLILVYPYFTGTSKPFQVTS